MTRSSSPDSVLQLVKGTRALLRASTVEEVVDTCCLVVRGLGGRVLPARLAGDNAIPIDLSFGHGEPLLATAPSASVRQLLEDVLPDLVDDARVAVVSVRKVGDLSEEATVDGLTGLLNRRSIDRILARLRVGDTVIMMDLDHFKEVNDQLGHAAGDVVLTAFARVFRAQSRAGDYVGRLGGDEFIAILPRSDKIGARSLLERLRADWIVMRPQPVDFSAGVATSIGESAPEVVARADEDLYAVKAVRHKIPFTLRLGVA